MRRLSRLGDERLPAQGAPVPGLTSRSVPRSYDSWVLLTRPAVLDDLSSWLELVPEVEGLFGPMPDLETHIRQGIERGTALVVDSGNDVAGAALLSRDGRPHHVRWLAVRRSQRRQGVGAAIVSAVLERWRTGDVNVVTFTAKAPDGGPARRLYERFGFVCVGPSEPAPDGGLRDQFVLRRESTDIDDDRRCQAGSLRCLRER